MSKSPLNWLCCALIAASAVIYLAVQVTIGGNRAACPAALRRTRSQQTIPASKPVLLETGKAIDRNIGPGGEQSFAVNLAAAQYAKVTVEQQGVDVAVDLLRPDGVLIAQFDDEIRPRGIEEIGVVSEGAGAYTLRIKGKFRGLPSGSCRISLVEIRRATDDDRSFLELRKLLTESANLRISGKYDEALPLAERALATGEKVLGPNHVFVARLATNLAAIYQNKIQNGKARPLFERALGILEGQGDPDNPQIAFVKGRLASIYMFSGNYAKADQFLRQALEESEKSLGPDHPQVAIVLQTLGIFRANRGDTDEAEKTYMRALAIAEKTLPPDSGFSSDLLTNIGVLYSDRGDYAKAEPYLERALAIGERRWGKDNLYLANTLQDLGIVELHGKKDYAAAEQYYRRALSIREKAHGLYHSDVAANMINLANLYSAKGDLAKSLDTHLRALAILQRTAGPSQWVTIMCLGNIVTAYETMGDVPNALAYQKRVDAAIETDIALNIATGSEREKLAYLESISDRTDRTISLNTMLAPDNPEASELAATVVLQRKGRSFDAASADIAALRKRSTGEGRALLDQLNTTTTQLAEMVLRGPQTLPIDEYQTRVQQLESKKERLESDASAYSAQFLARSQRVTLEAVQSAIPSGAALVEIAVYSPFNAKAADKDSAYGAPRYVAYVVRHSGAPGHVDLGEAKLIDDQARDLIKALRDPSRSDVESLARVMDDRIMRPVRNLIGNSGQLLISADGQLNLIPFEALVDEQGRFLVELYAISYLTTGRDLLRMGVARQSKSKPEVIANPTFGEPRTILAAVAASTKSRPGADQRSMTIADNLSETYFASLPGTAAEANAIRSCLPDATVLTGAAATESAIKQVEAPTILHIATHGFFIEPPTNKDGSSSGGGNSDPEIENPLLRSGLAFAGANLHQTGDDNGILTALEASGLNLWGTKLVTLSACDTGVGEVKNGEGVYGLRRAFLLAGAETLVMSLWPVSDYATRELMVGYYKNLEGGMGRGEALRRVQLNIQKHRGRRHPYYWASFIQSGDWRKL